MPYDFLTDEENADVHGRQLGKVAERRHVAVLLYKTRGWKHQQIAEALEVSKTTVNHYLAGVATKNPRGRKRGRVPEAITATMVAEVVDKGRTIIEVSEEAKVSRHELRGEVLKEEARREAELAVTPKSLSMSARKKFEVLERRLRREIAAEVQAKVEELIVRRHQYMSETDLETIRNAERVMSRTKGYMSLPQYRDLQLCLHTDTHRSVSEETLNRSFQLVTELRGILVREATTQAPDRLPRTSAELMRQREEVRRQRQAARARGQAAV